MSDIPGINEGAPRRPAYVDLAAQMTKGLVNTEKGVQLVREVAALLGDRSLNLGPTASAKDNFEPGKVGGATGVPVLDNPDDVKALQADLEKLISYLQLDNDKRQAAMAKDRIELQKDELKTTHENRMAKLKESLKKMDKAALGGILSKILTGFLAAVAVAIAVVACVASGGLAIGAIVGASVAVIGAVLTVSGAMDEITEALAKALEDAGMSKKAAQIVAAVAIAVIMAAASLGAGFGTSAIAGGAQIAAKAVTAGISATAQATAKAIETTLKVVNALGTIASLGIGAGSTIAGYESGKSQADLKEMEKFLAIIRQSMEESEEELQKILDQIQNVYANMAQLLDSATDTVKEIAQKMGQMA